MTDRCVLGVGRLHTILRWWSVVEAGAAVVVWVALAVAAAIVVVAVAVILHCEQWISCRSVGRALLHNQCALQCFTRILAPVRIGALVGIRPHLPPWCMLAPAGIVGAAVFTPELYCPPAQLGMRSNNALDVS